MSRRREVTETILGIMPVCDRITTDHALRTWYRNIRSTGGFRLTELGYQALIQAGIQSWQTEINPKDLTRTGILALDRQMQWPYYIDTRRRRMIMFGSSEAMMITLYGDVRRYLGIPVPAPGDQKS